MYIREKGEVVLKHYRQVYHHFLQDNFPEAWSQIQKALKNKEPIPKVYPSYRRFMQIIKSYNVSIQIPKKDYCGTCKAYDCLINHGLDKNECELFKMEKKEHQELAWDIRQCFAGVKKLARKTHDLPE